MRAFVLVVILWATGFAMPASADDLQRRGLLGLALRTDADTGLVITDVLNPSLTAARKDDILVSVDGQNVPSVPAIAAILAGRRGGAPVAIQVRRGSLVLDIAGTVMEAPWPALDGVRLDLGHVTIGTGTRIRTMMLPPKSDALRREGLAPAVMMIGGIGCTSGEVFAQPDHPDMRLYRMLTQAGFAVFIVDKPGVGDSEGTACARGGFDVEVDAYEAAAAALTKTPGIDPKRLFIIGLSMGGVQAPLVAKAIPFKGIVTWGPAVMPWYEYLLTTFRHRGILRGDDAMAVEPGLREWRKVMAAAFVDGQTRDEIAARMPETLQAVEAREGSIDAIGGRSLLFHQECDRANVVAGWQAYAGRLLALHGEYDWISEDYDHRLAAVIVNQKRPGAGLFEIVPDLDHNGTQHPSLAESFQKSGEGQPSDASNTRAVEWLMEEARS